MPDLLLRARTTKQLGLYNSNRVRKVIDRGETDFIQANYQSSQKDEPIPHDGAIQVDVELDRAHISSFKDPNKRYIPRHKMLELLNPDVVRTILSEPCFERYPDKDELMEDIFHKPRRLKLLAVLIGIDKVSDLPEYMEDGVDDQCLPMALDSAQGIFCRKHNKYHQTLKSYRRPNDRIQFSLWSYALTAPYISYSPGRHSHYVLDPEDVFPMTGAKIHKTITTNGSTPMAPLPPGVNLDGGFSEVYRIKIEDSHYNFGELGIRHPDKVFALKKLNTSLEEEFNMELSSLLFSMDKSSGKTASKHLIQLLATFEVSDPTSQANCPTYYLLFDWAEGNLKEFWKMKEKEYVRNRNHCKWMSQQFHEICLALQYVHNERKRTLTKFINNNPEMTPDGRSDDVHDLYGRHGDIKSDNFLWFRPEQSSDLLALSDFGLGRLHTQVSRSNQNPKDLARTATYIAPEFDLKDGRVSRASDVYSLGCVLLEYVTWFLRGFNSVINDFPDKRMDEDIYIEWTSDKFFKILDDKKSGAQTPILKPAVRQWILELQQHEDCSWYLHQLLEVIRDKMLESDRNKRIDIASLAVEMEKLRRTCEDDESFYLEAKTEP
ncbi:protein kinase [Annulohypoxylon bovei var. microspora]|nr:protein kinase [Annulohypoxylon bovei var. microspora]